MMEEIFILAQSGQSIGMWQTTLNVVASALVMLSMFLMKKLFNDIAKVEDDMNKAVREQKDREMKQDEKIDSVKEKMDSEVSRLREDLPQSYVPRKEFLQIEKNNENRFSMICETMDGIKESIEKIEKNGRP